MCTLYMLRISLFSGIQNISSAVTNLSTQLYSLNAMLTLRDEASMLERKTVFHLLESVANDVKSLKQHGTCCLKSKIFYIQRLLEKCSCQSVLSSSSQLRGTNGPTCKLLRRIRVSRMCAQRATDQVCLENSACSISLSKVVYQVCIYLQYLQGRNHQDPPVSLWPVSWCVTVATVFETTVLQCSGLHKTFTPGLHNLDCHTWLARLGLRCD